MIAGTKGCPIFEGGIWMSLKSIEMQIALPRTQDAGKIQSDHHERGTIMQSQIAASVEKQEFEKRKKVVEQEKSRNVKNETKNEKKDNHYQMRKTKNNKEKDEAIPHPYKGKIIDISG